MITEKSPCFEKNEFITKRADFESLKNPISCSGENITVKNKYKAVEGTQGHKNIELLGSIRNTGLMDIPEDYTLKEIIYDIGGGIKGGKKFKAIQLGGASGICLNADYLDLKIYNDSLKAIGFTGRLDSIIVMDDCTCILDVARLSISTIITGLCGKCIPCREGTKKLLEIVDEIASGKGRIENINILYDLIDTIRNTSLCKLGKVSVNAVESTLRFFKDEYIAHIVQKKCPAGLAAISMNEGKEKSKGNHINEGDFICHSHIA